MFKKSREQKGITLIALIITIVVLLILAVVAIEAVQDGGIIQYAQKAKKRPILPMVVKPLSNQRIFLVSLKKQSILSYVESICCLVLSAVDACAIAD